MRYSSVAALGCALACVACPAALCSQQTALAKPRSYAAEAVVVRTAEAVYDMKADGTGVATTTMAITVQTEAALRQFGVVSTAYAKQSQKADFVYARVRHADGAVAETPLDGVQEQAAPVTREAPFYSDLMFKQLPIKGMRVGDTLEWQTRTVRTVAEAPGQFWESYNFGKDAVVLDQHVELRVPSGQMLTVWTNPEVHLKPEESDAAGEHIYRWQWKQLDPMAGPEAEALKKAKKDKPLTADEQKDAVDGPLPDVAWTTFPNWQAVGAWYRSLEGDRMQPDAGIKAKVAEITAGKATEDQKVRAVYAWVAGQIRYVGVALGLGRYQPHNASAVLDNQYGDCKDKHTLLASMLIALGLHPDAVLAGVEVRFNPEVPSPGAFNHLFTHVTVDGKEVWLDTTSEVAPYQVLTAPTRDKQVLVIPDAGLARVARTPAALPFTPQSTFAVAGTLDGSLTSESTISMTNHDDMELLLRSALRQVSPANYGDFVERMMASFGFGGKVSQVEIDHPDDPSQPLTIRFHYHRERSEDWGENRITANFSPILLPAVDEKDLPRAPLELGLQRTETSTLEMKLPQGWSMELPEAVHARSSAANCDVTYRLDNGSLHAERKLTVLQSRLPVEQMKAYAAWYKDCGANGVPFLQLVNGAPSAAVAKFTSEAAKLVASADLAIRQRDYDAAAKDLEAAKAANANQRGLWGDLGAVAMHRNNTKEAIRLYSKEIELHPESGFAYPNLARLQLQAGDRNAELETYQRWIRSSPTRALNAVEALATLLATNDNEGAVQVARVAETVSSEEARADERLRLEIGEAEIRAGDAQKGQEFLDALLKETKDPQFRNDADYELASMGKELALVEKTQRGVLDELAEESRNWTGDEAQSTLAQRSSLMLAAWDTMGWIFFKEGKAPKAEPWIEAAWHGRSSAEVSGHMGDVMMAQGKTEQAVRFYRQGAMLNPAQTATAGQIALHTEMESKLHAAEKGIKTPVKPPNPVDELQRGPTFPLGPSQGNSGMATFYLMLSPTGILKAKLLPGEAMIELHDRLKTVKLDGFFPPNLDARLIRQGTVNCHQALCELILAP